jgi:hypothetical protein
MKTLQCPRLKYMANNQSWKSIYVTPRTVEHLFTTSFLPTLLILKKKIKVGLWDHHGVCVYVNSPPPPINF